MSLGIQSTEDVQRILRRIDPARLVEFRTEAEASWGPDRLALMQSIVDQGLSAWKAAKARRKSIHLPTRSLGDLYFIARQVEEELRVWFGKPVGAYVAELVEAGRSEDVPASVVGDILEGAKLEGLEVECRLVLVVTKRVEWQEEEGDGRVEAGRDRGGGAVPEERQIGVEDGDDPGEGDAA
jgi:hypothetical protein